MVAKACQQVLNILARTWLPAGLVLVMSAPAKAALSVTPSIDAAAMAKALLVKGMNLVDGSATYTGASGASGFFTGDTTIFGNPAGVNGVLLTTGHVSNSLGPNNRPDASKENSTNSNPLRSDYLSSLIDGLDTFDAATLTFKITLDPGTTGIEWNYVFGSEEYNDGVGDIGALFSDIFALSLNGSNIALIPGSTTPITINTINNGNPLGTSCVNCNLFRYNPEDTPGSPSPIHSQYNGLTTVLKASKQGLKAGVEYELSFSIADATDATFDSGVYIAGASLQSPGPPETAPVPAPLPVLGAGAAFGWSRRLRRRVRRLQLEEG